LNCEVAAVANDGIYDYPQEVKFIIRQDHLEDYISVANRISALNPAAVCIQHEFGIFGGPAGGHLTAFLDIVKCPVFSTLHTILESPDNDQRATFARLLARSDRLIVMAERGIQILKESWGLDDDRTDLIPHGIPQNLGGNADYFPPFPRLAGREVLLTFGLLSPDKGIETVIKAMPHIITKRPQVLYVLAGATHPNLISQQGEQYRESLITLADALGVTSSICFINEYLSASRLLGLIAKADICITPYKKENQITSGTLSYAAGLGKAIISTPFWHAREILKHGRGVLVPFGDHTAITDSVLGLLSDREWRRRLERDIFDTTRDLLWTSIGHRYARILLRSDALVRPTPMVNGQ
jgi:glycosyltransferase involved in cell wall biosynthesis